MNIEHFAINVEDPVKMAAWYTENLGMKVVHHIPEPVQMHFLADESGGIIEIYRNPPDQVPDYRKMDPLNLHIAFCSDSPAADAVLLVKAGASMVSETTLPDGTQLSMLKDPWGVSVQLCKRAKPLLRVP